MSAHGSRQQRIEEIHSTLRLARANSASEKGDQLQMLQHPSTLHPITALLGPGTYTSSPHREAAPLAKYLHREQTSDVTCRPKIGQNGPLAPLISLRSSQSGEIWRNRPKDLRGRPPAGKAQCARTSIFCEFTVQYKAVAYGGGT